MRRPTITLNALDLWALCAFNEREVIAKFDPPLPVNEMDGTSRTNDGKRDGSRPTSLKSQNEYKPSKTLQKHRFFLASGL